MSDGHLSAVLIFYVRDFLVLSRDVTEALKTAGYLPDINGSTRTETPSPESPGPSGLDEEGRYRLALSPLQYEELEFASEIFLTEREKHINEIWEKLMTSKTKRTIAYEIATISNAESLPCCKSSSILVRSDESKMSLLKAVITG